MYLRNILGSLDPYNELLNCRWHSENLRNPALQYIQWLFHNFRMAYSPMKGTSTLFLDCTPWNIGCQSYSNNSSQIPSRGQRIGNMTPCHCRGSSRNYSQGLSPCNFQGFWFGNPKSLLVGYRSRTGRVDK